MGALVLVVALGAALAAPRLDLPGIGGDDLADDGIALPDDAAGTVTPSSAPTDGPPRCTRDGVRVDCVRWAVPHAPDASFGPRMGGVLAEVSESEGLVVREPDTGEVRWARPDLATVRVQAHADDVLVLVSPEGVARGVDLADGTDRWTLDAAPVGIPSVTPGGHVVLGRGPDGTAVTSLAGVEPGSGEVAWEWAPPWGGTVRMARPALGGDAVVVVGPERVASVDGRDGTTSWVADTVADGYPTIQPPDHVAVQQLAEGGAALWVHDAATGEVVFRRDGIVGLVVVDGAAITHDPTEQELLAVDLATGDLLWRRDTPPALELAGSADPAAITGALVLRDGLSGTVTRRDPRTGEPVWTTDVPPGRLTRSNGTFLGRPQVVDDLVVIEDSASVVTVLDLATGDERVRIDAGPALDVRSFAPLTLLRDDTWIAVDLPPRADP